ncbi:aspergillopepsin A precursor [Bipolaris maydis]|nr:aspergillopepsin A precursor [Bipolaris maydis]
MASLQRIAVQRSPVYKPSGTKSYLHAMRKYGFHPTKPGPYLQAKQFRAQGKFGGQVGGRIRAHYVLAKKKHHHHSTASTTGGSGTDTNKPTTGGTTPAAGDDVVGEVPAEDVQNDSLYLCEVGVWSTELPQNVLSQANTQNQQVAFDPTKSSTFKRLEGSTWKISYGDSSSASGDVGTDVLDLGGIKIQNQAIELAKQLSQQFAQGNGSGLLGLAFDTINTVSPTPQKTPVDNIIAQNPGKPQLFTAYLGSWRDANEADKGELLHFWLHRTDVLNALGSNPNYTPVDSSQGFWQIESTSATINGQTINRSVYKAIPGSKYDESNQGYLFPANTSVDQLPQVTLAIGNQQVEFQKEDLGFADAGNGMVYGSIQSRGSMNMDIYGDAVLKAIYAIFDMNNGQPRFGWLQRKESNQNTGVPS